MRMSRIEKLLVNRRDKGMSNVEVVRRQLDVLGNPANGRALEVGSGAGEVSAYLARERHYRVVGADVDSDQVELARSRYGEDEHLQFVVADAGNLRLETSSIDLIVAQNVFHHLPDWRPGVHELARILRPGGYMLWVDLTPTRLMKTILHPLSDRFGVYTLDEIRAAFREAGFVEVMMRRPVRWLPLRHELILRKGSVSHGWLSFASASVRT